MCPINTFNGQSAYSALAIPIVIGYTLDMDSLTAYELSCGCVQICEQPIIADGTSGSIRTTMWKEHGSYHVRTHNHATHVRLVWNVFPTLKDARREFNTQVRQVRTGILY